VESSVVVVEVMSVGEVVESKDDVEKLEEGVVSVLEEVLDSIEELE